METSPARFIMYLTLTEIGSRVLHMEDKRSQENLAGTQKQLTEVEVSRPHGLAIQGQMEGRTPDVVYLV